MTLASMVFTGLSIALLVLAGGLAVLGSFAYVAVGSVAIFFLAAGLITNAVGSRTRRTAALVMLLGVALTVFGLAGTPLFYAGLGAIAGGLVLAIVSATRQ